MQLSFTHEQLLEGTEGAEESDFKGTVTVKMPMFHERTKLLGEIGLLELGAAGNKRAKEGEEPDPAALRSQIDVIARGAEKIHGYIQAVDLRDAEGTEIKSADDFSAHPGCQDLLVGLVMKFLISFMGKKKKPLPESK